MAELAEMIRADMLAVADNADAELASGSFDDVLRATIFYARLTRLIEDILEAKSQGRTVDLVELARIVAGESAEAS